MKAALYARVSTRDKDQNPETQLLPLREWAVRLEYDTIEYVDYASGKDLNRPQWRSLVGDWRRGKFGVIAVLRLDRAFRSVADMHNVLQEIEGRGIRFVSVTQPMDTGTAVGRLLVNVLGSIAEFERDLIRERVKEGVSRAQRNGTRSGKAIGRPRVKLSVRRVREAVAEHGSQRAAAKALGVALATLQRRLEAVP
jgi:DNA invertase Pin-like site-specific DNA recombinase